MQTVYQVLPPLSPEAYAALKADIRERGGGMQVLGYVSVSTGKQADHGVSLDAQTAKLHAYATVKDWTLVEVIRDESASAKSLHREGLTRLMGLVERLTRSVSDLNTLVRLFDKAGVALVSLQESLDATTATGRLMMNLFASVSQWEREVIGERTREALQHLKAQGQRYCHSVYADATIIARMHHMRAAGQSYAAIAAASEQRRRADGARPAVAGHEHLDDRAPQTAGTAKEDHMKVEERLFSIPEVAERLGVSKYTVNEWLKVGRIKGTRIGRFWRVRARDLEAFIENPPPLERKPAEIDAEALPPLPPVVDVQEED